MKNVTIEYDKYTFSQYYRWQNESWKFQIVRCIILYCNTIIKLYVIIIAFKAIDIGFEVEKRISKKIEKFKSFLESFLNKVLKIETFWIIVFKILHDQ